MDLVYDHYDDLLTYIRGASKYLKNNQYLGNIIPRFRKVYAKNDFNSTPGKITKVISGNPKHTYAFYSDPETKRTILEIREDALDLMFLGEKAAAKQTLQAIVGSTNDFALKGLSRAEKYLFPQRYLKGKTVDITPKDAVTYMMVGKAKAGIKESYDNLSPENLKKLAKTVFDMKLFDSRGLSFEEFFKKNKEALRSLANRVPSVIGAGLVGSKLSQEYKDPSSPIFNWNSNDQQ